MSSIHGSNQYTEKVTEYDKNGNIKKLQRYGQIGSSTYGLVDNLTYTYNGNKVTRVDDATTATSYTGGTNFINGASTSNEYVYDQNGNLTKDLNKNISNIQYNSLNLPSIVTFSDGSTITYTYTHDGKKLRTVHVIGGVTTTTDYCGNVIYENGTAKKLLTDEGYVDLTATTPTYYYYLKDHQGNNRAVVNASASVKESNDYYPFGGLFATNGSVQNYKYNGKELDTKKGLNLYDYGARHYDAALGRFTTIDPSSENYLSLGSYVYCANSPIIYIDPTGMDYWSTSDKEEIDRFFTWYGQNGSSYSFPSDYWYHMSDDEFQTAYDRYGAQALTYNDQTNMAYTSYGTVENGEVVIHGVSTYMGESGWPGFNASQSLLLWGMDVGADKLRNSAATFRFLNSKGGWNPKLYRNGWRGNQYVNTSKIANVGTFFKRTITVMNVASGVNSFYLSYQANSIEKQLEYGTDGIITLAGTFHPATALFSLYWSLGGKQLHKSYNEKVIKKQMEMGLNPGLPALQPFK